MTEETLNLTLTGVVAPLRAGLVSLAGCGGETEGVRPTSQTPGLRHTQLLSHTLWANASAVAH